MSFLLDTNVAIHLRDSNDEIDRRIDALEPPLLLSVITRVELEADLGRSHPDLKKRTDRLNALLEVVPTLSFGMREADAYRGIIQACGFSRRKVLDHMIAAQALVAGATLVTLNASDFADIPGLDILAW